MSVEFGINFMPTAPAREVRGVSLFELREEYRQRWESEFRRGPGSPLDLRPLPVPVPLPNQRRTR